MKVPARDDLGVWTLPTPGHYVVASSAEVHEICVLIRGYGRYPGTKEYFCSDETGLSSSHAVACLDESAQIPGEATKRGYKVHFFASQPASNINVSEQEKDDDNGMLDAVELG